MILRTKNRNTDARVAGQLSMCGQAELLAGLLGKKFKTKGKVHRERERESSFLTANDGEARRAEEKENKN